MTTTRELWENTLTDLELSLPKAAFTTWFRDTHIVRIENGIVYVGVPSQIVREWFLNKYHKLILGSLRQLEESVRSIEYVISRHPKKAAEEITRSNLGELPLESVHTQTNLNPRHTFDAFIVGPFNELAHAAAQAVIRKPGLSYNPLFIYGDTGLGKTHLIQAIGNHFRANTDYKVYYITSERFYLEYVSAMQENKTPQFKEKYRTYDLLVMDDIQFLSDKTGTQEELFHLFNALFDKNKQLVFSSDQHPNLIRALAARLRSRFNQGMVASITPPDHESRLAILRTKAAQRGVVLQDDIYDCLALSVEGNVRELEGALNSLLLSSEMRSGPLTVIEVKNLLRTAQRPKKAVSIGEVVKLVADFYGIEETSIYEKTRRKEVVRPRQIIMFVLREDFHISFPTIGERLGGRDHTTVIHSCDKVRTDIKSDMLLLQEVNQIRGMLK